MREVYKELYHILILQEYLLPLLFVLNTFLGGTTLLSVFAEQSYVDTSCCECHSEICEIDMNRTSIHLPFQQQQCPVCHVKTDEAKGQPPKLMEIPGYLPHLAMRDINELSSISVCTQCHTGFTKTGNHPLKVHPLMKVTIPADYSTSSDGDIICITCHANHASDFQFRTIKSRRKALCVGCHKGYP